MGLLLAEADKLNLPDMLRGVVVHFVTRSGVVKFLNFRTTVGESFDWNRQLTLPVTTMVDENEKLVTSDATYTAKTVKLRKAHVASDVSQFITTTMTEGQDVEAATIAQASQSMLEKFLDQFFYGAQGTNTKEPTGLHGLIVDADTGLTEAASALNLSTLNKMLGLMKLGKHVIFLKQDLLNRMTDALYVLANATYRLAGEDLGRPPLFYNGLPLIVEDSLTLTETDADPPVKTGGSNMSLFALNTDEVEAGGLVAIQGQATHGMKLLRIPVLEDYDSARWRLIWYYAFADGSRYAIGRVRGITDAAVAA